MSAGENRLLPSGDPRWRHLYYISEEISKSAARSTTEGVGPLLADLRNALTSVYEAFPKELDPVQDPEGFATRRFVKALLDALEGLEREFGER